MGCCGSTPANDATAAEREPLNKQEEDVIQNFTTQFSKENSKQLQEEEAGQSIVDNTLRNLVVMQQHTQQEATQRTAQSVSVDRGVSVSSLELLYPGAASDAVASSSSSSSTPTRVTLCSDASAESVACVAAAVAAEAARLGVRPGIEQIMLGFSL
eukprot:TRINITY_DN5977_c0_g1_i1.p1 TRINITY_DN5977_c0_g1~~TRINITY_DN5977_c0_g1_i1.p1  ORF type:complete len:156 (+),score=49.18 TRINITY_DN5977_c0_g1_i1:10-477(+)